MYRAFSWRSRSSLVFKKILKAYSKNVKEHGRNLQFDFSSWSILWFRLLVFHRKTSVRFFYLCLGMWRNFRFYFSSWSILWFRLLVFHRKTSVRFFLFMFRHERNLQFHFSSWSILWFRRLFLFLIWKNQMEFSVR